MQPVYKFGFKRLLAVLLFVFSANSGAVTICSFNCPDTNEGSGDPQLPTIVEIVPIDDGDLLLNNDGLILLDIVVFNNLPGLSINPLTPIYFGPSALPSNIILPDLIELNEISYSGNLSLTGTIIDYVLLRQFEDGNILDLTTTDGVIVMDTDLLFITPLPGASILFFSGLITLVSFGTKKSNKRMQSDPAKLGR